MRYAWFGLACFAVAFGVFHFTFKIDRSCTFHATGGSHVAKGLVGVNGRPISVPNGTQSCGHSIAFR